MMISKTFPFTFSLFFFSLFFAAVFSCRLFGLSSLFPVRRSSSKRENLLPKQNSQSESSTSPLAYQRQDQEFRPSCSGDVCCDEPSDLVDHEDQQHLPTSPIDRYTKMQTNLTTMQSTSSAAATTGGNNISNNASSASGEVSGTVDLTTEALPAVDTPDACDKAALRYEQKKKRCSNKLKSFFAKQFFHEKFSIAFRKRTNNKHEFFRFFFLL